MPKGVLVVRLTHNYHSDLIKELINNGLPIKLVAISDRVEYQPDKLESFLKENKINSFNYEPLYRPDRFEKIYSPNFQKLNNKFLEKISY